MWHQYIYIEISQVFDECLLYSRYLGMVNYQCFPMENSLSRENGHADTQSYRIKGWSQAAGEEWLRKSGVGESYLPASSPFFHLYPLPGYIFYPYYANMIYHAYGGREEI